MCSFPDEEGVWIQRLVRARQRSLACYECGLTIPRGRLFWTVSYGAEEKIEGNLSLHPECYTLALRAAEVVCGSGDYLAGELDEHLEIAEEALIDVFLDREPMSDYDPDEDAAREILFAAEAIRHRYDGVERDLGGEGG